MQFIYACAAVLACFAPGRWNSLNEPKHRTNDIERNGPSPHQVSLAKREPDIARALRSISLRVRGSSDSQNPNREWLEEKKFEDVPAAAAAARSARSCLCVVATLISPVS
jgi:hypothetical protein